MKLVVAGSYREYLKWKEEGGDWNPENSKFVKSSADLMGQDMEDVVFYGTYETRLDIDEIKMIVEAGLNE